MAGPTSVRFCNEMLELCGYQEDALNEWKQRIQEGDSCTREQYIQIEKEQQALREIQAKSRTILRCGPNLTRSLKQRLKCRSGVCLGMHSREWW